jgi:hypothetical protein
MFEPLKDPDRFAEWFVDTELATIAWPNGAGLSSEYLYYGEHTPYGSIAINKPTGVF